MNAEDKATIILNIIDEKFQAHRVPSTSYSDPIFQTILWLTGFTPMGVVMQNMNFYPSDRYCEMGAGGIVRYRVVTVFAINDDGSYLFYNSHDLQYAFSDDTESNYNEQWFGIENIDFIKSSKKVKMTLTSPSVSKDIEIPLVKNDGKIELQDLYLQ